MKKGGLVKSFFTVLFLVLLLVSCRGGASFSLTLPEGVEVVSSENLDLGAIADGTEITLEVTIPENKTVGCFKVNGTKESLDANNRYTFKMTANTTVDVNFVDITYSLTLPEDNSVSVVTPANLDLNSVVTGTEVTLVVTIPENKAVGSFTVNGVNQSFNASNQYTFTISEDTIVAVTFVDMTYSLTLPEDDSVSVVTPANLDLNSVVTGTEITLEVTIPQHKILAIFTVNEVEQSLDDSHQYTFTISENTTVAVTFVDMTYSLTLPVDDSVSVVTPANLELNSVVSGTEITLEVTTPEHKTLDSFTVNEVEQSLDSSNQYTFTISENTTVAVTFVYLTYTLTLPSSVSVDSPSGLDLNSVNSGTEITLEVTIPENKAVGSFKVNGEDQSLDSSNQYTFTISENTTVTVTFIDAFSLTLPDKNAEVVSPSGIDLNAIPAGTEVTYRVFIDDGYDTNYETISELLEDSSSLDFVYECKIESNQVKAVFVEKTITMNSDHTIEVNYDDNKAIPPFNKYKVGDNNVITLIGYVDTSISNLLIPHFVSIIGDSALTASSFNSIEICDGVSSIGDWAFNSLASEMLQIIFIPDSVTEMGQGVFAYCDHLTDINCQASSKPDGWNNDWVGNYISFVNWGQSRP